MGISVVRGDFRCLDRSRGGGEVSVAQMKQLCHSRGKCDTRRFGSTGRSIFLAKGGHIDIALAWLGEWVRFSLGWALKYSFHPESSDADT